MLYRVKSNILFFLVLSFFVFNSHNALATQRNCASDKTKAAALKRAEQDPQFAANLSRLFELGLADEKRVERLLQSSERSRQEPPASNSTTALPTAQTSSLKKPTMPPDFSNQALGDLKLLRSSNNSLRRRVYEALEMLSKDPTGQIFLTNPGRWRREKMLPGEVARLGQSPDAIVYSIRVSDGVRILFRVRSGHPAEILRVSKDAYKHGS